MNEQDRNNGTADRETLNAVYWLVILFAFDGCVVMRLVLAAGRLIFLEHPVNPGYFTYRLQSLSTKQRCNYRKSLDLTREVRHCVLQCTTRCTVLLSIDTRYTHTSDASRRGPFQRAIPPCEAPQSSADIRRHVGLHLGTILSFQPLYKR